MKNIDDCRLYAFVDTAYLRGRAPADVARALCSGGADIVQLRAKDATPPQVRAMAEAILPITRAHGVPLVINDHPEIARAADAELYHLGQEDFFDERGGRIESAPPAFGLSTHAPAQAERALAVHPAYIAIGPVYATDTKPGAAPVTLEYVRWAARTVAIPWFAIGGVNLATLDAVLAAGARRVCVVSAILNQNDVAGACREFKRRLAAV